MVICPCFEGEETKPIKANSTAVGDGQKKWVPVRIAQIENLRKVEIFRSAMRH